MIRSLPLKSFFLLLLVSPASAEIIEQLRRGDSGFYGGRVVTVGVDARKGIVTGLFSDGTDTSCRFFFSGKLERTGYVITAWNASDPNGPNVPGEFRFRENSDGRMGFYFKIPNVRLIGTCGAVAPYLVRGEFLPQDSVGDWTSVRIVAKQTYFFRKPGQERMRAYLISGDVIYVNRADKSGWVEAEYEATKGWINESDLFPILPPTPAVPKNP